MQYGTLIGVAYDGAIYGLNCAPMSADAAEAQGNGGAMLTGQDCDPHDEHCDACHETLYECYLNEQSTNAYSDRLTSAEDTALRLPRCETDARVRHECADSGCSAPSIAHVTPQPNGATRYVCMRHFIAELRCFPGAQIVRCNQARRVAAQQYAIERC